MLNGSIGIETPETIEYNPNAGKMVLDVKGSLVCMILSLSVLNERVEHESLFGRKRIYPPKPAALSQGISQYYRKYP
jgi:hypothetical protein